MNKFSIGDRVQIVNENCIVPKWRNATGTIVGYFSDIPGTYELYPDDKSLSNGTALVSGKNIRSLNRPINVEDLI